MIRQKDRLLHHPYDSFTVVQDFVRRAASDPHVLAIKMTLYRTGSNSEIVRALVAAAENGKQVAVSIEIKARFDEANNIAWARTLERAGAHVFFGHAASKTHAKVTLVVRQESDGVRRYVHLGTGNYNAGTARLYTDVGLLSASPELGEDVSELYNSLSGFSKKSRYRKLAVAPTGLIEALLARIEEQAARAQSGGRGYVFAKMNALVDVRVIQALYRASAAGVKIDLCVRGVCCLRPGVPGVSENIRVFSIVGRFLEHERVFLFGAPGEEQWFLSSADWMPRNLHRRVEVLFPLETPALREQLRREVIEPALADTGFAYDMRADGTYARRVPAEGVAARGAQSEALERTLGLPGDGGRAAATTAAAAAAAPSDRADRRPRRAGRLIRPLRAPRRDAGDNARARPCANKRERQNERFDEVARRSAHVGDAGPRARLGVRRRDRRRIERRRSCRHGRRAVGRPRRRRAGRRLAGGGGPHRRGVRGRRARHLRQARRVLEQDRRHGSGHHPPLRHDERVPHAAGVAVHGRVPRVRLGPLARDGAGVRERVRELRVRRLLRQRRADVVSAGRVAHHRRGVRVQHAVQERLLHG